MPDFWARQAAEYTESFMSKEEADKLHAETREAVLAQGKPEAYADDVARVTVNCTRAQRGWKPGKISQQFFALKRLQADTGY